MIVKCPRCCKRITQYQKLELKQGNSYATSKFFDCLQCEWCIEVIEN